jgi:hypothetical protein
MKKITLLLITIVTLVACSSDDNDGDDNTSTNSGYFFKATFDSENYTEQNELLGEVFWEETDCNTDKDLWRVYIGQVETSSLFIDANLMYFQNSSEFDDTTPGVRDVVPSWWTVNANCYSHFELMLDLVVAGDLYIVNSSANNSNNITSITMVSENNQEVIYSVEGTYDANFHDELDNSSTARVTGSYRTPLHILK